MVVDLLLLGLGLLLTVGTAIFVAAEFSLVALDPATVDARAEEGDAQAQQVQKALHNLSLQLSACQVGITLTTILLGYVAQAPLQRIFEMWLGNSAMAATAAVAVAAAGAFIVVNLVSMLFGELVPKNMALAEPLRVGALVSAPLRGFTAAFRPLIVALNNSANWILRKFGVEPAEELSGARSATELTSLVKRSAEQGTLDISTAQLVTRSIGIGALTAEDVMTSRGRLHTLSSDSTAADVVELARLTGHSRFPVIGDDIDDVLGIVHLRKAVAVPYERRSSVAVNSSSLMVPASKVPETLALAPLLVQLREEASHLAMVVDEYGGISGMVTLEDAIEEIIGEVADEHDRRRSGIRKYANGGWLVPGDKRPDEVLRETGIEIPEDTAYETIAGWLLVGLGEIPAQGATYREGNIVARVESMDGRRIELVLLRTEDSE